jgi:YidC/Oxa1 family membrane protein insertase
MDVKRLLIWITLSLGILVGWNYLFPPPTRTPNQPEKRPVVEQKQPQAAQQSTSTPQTPSEQLTSAPERTLTVNTPLYSARFHSRGAIPVSWIVHKNKQTGRPLHGVDRKPLELISPEGLKAEPKEAPLRIITGDANVDRQIATQNYVIESDSIPSEGNAVIDLKPGESRAVTFRLRDQSGVEIQKRILFNADQYNVDLQVEATRGGRPLEGNIAIGPSIGDQSVPEYTFYSVAPEAIAELNGVVERRTPSAINEKEENPDRELFEGNLQWAGVGDTYFAMVAIPKGKVQRVEYRTRPFDFKKEQGSEKRFLLTGYLPLTSRDFIIYAGPKDHYILEDVSATIGQRVGHAVDLGGLIDYGFLGSVSRPLAVPIILCIKYLHEVTNSYGLAIIIFTVLVYSLFFPLKWRSSKSMKKAQKLAPRMRELQDKIKGLKQNDPKLKDLQMEQLRLMKEGNPLGGCLPLLIQMPFIFALYRAITIYIDFRQASFLWLPDLSSHDPWHVLPVMMAGSMLVLQLVTPMPSADDVQRMQRNMMAVVLPLVMLYMLWSAPAGLLVYWLVGNVVGFVQQFLINRWLKSHDDEEPQPPLTKEAGKKKKLGAPRVSQA